MSDSTTPHDEPDLATASHVGYACGRLLAILAAIDASLGTEAEPSPAIAAFTVAGANPARGFGPLLMRSLPPLTLAVANRQATDLMIALADRFEEIMATLGTQFPTSLSAEGQAAFALGFLQERISLRTLDPSADHDEGRQDILVEEEFIDPDDIFPDDL